MTHNDAADNTVGGCTLPARPAPGTQQTPAGGTRSCLAPTFKISATFYQLRKMWIDLLIPISRRVMNIRRHYILFHAAYCVHYAPGPLCALSHSIAVTLHPRRDFIVCVGQQRVPVHAVYW